MKAGTGAYGLFGEADATDVPDPIHTDLGAAGVVGNVVWLWLVNVR
jgi:hypothetical protein